MLFYIIFGTNILTEGPMAVSIFFAYFRVSSKRNTKRSPNGMKPSRWSFLDRKQTRRLGVEVRNTTRHPRGRRARLGGRRAPRPRGPLVASPTYLFLLYIPTYPETIQEHHENLFPPPQPSVPVRSHLRPFRRSAGGGIDHGGLLHQHHSLSDDVWVFYHRPSGP